jgi:hypothetical protein
VPIHCELSPDFEPRLLASNLFIIRDRREVPIGNCLYKKQLGLFGLKFNIFGKKGKFSVKIMAIG